MPLHELALADTPHALHAGLSALDGLDVVGIDVERADWDRYYRQAALIQVGGEGRVVLVDPLALDDLTALGAFLVERTCVLHAAENDIGPLANAGVDLGRVEDTSIAAALLGLPMGLETLLHDCLGVAADHDKQAMQRADWEARPLTPEMLAYAAGDVADLPALWRLLWQRLEEADRAPWYRQELAATLAQPSVAERRDWSRTKGAGRLDASARGRLRALWDAREALAQADDSAPGRIAADKVLLDLATRPPSSLKDLPGRGMRRQSVRTYGQRLLEALQDTASEPRERQGPGPTEEDRAVADRLRALRSTKAEEIGIDAGLLCPSRLLLAAVMTKPRTPDELREALGLREWQWSLLAPAFCAALNLGSSSSEAVGPQKESSSSAAIGHRKKETGMAELLNPDAIHHNLDQFEGWEGDQTAIRKQFTFDDFGGSIAFTNRVARVAEAMNHHPDITINWNKVTLEIVTHSAGGVTQGDFDLAQRIEEEAAGDPDAASP